MAKVPVYEGNYVREQRLPGVQQSVSHVNIGAFGGKKDEAGDVINIVNKVRDDFSKEENERITEDFYAKEAAYGSEFEAQRQEAEKRQGKNAVGVQQDLMKWVDENGAKYLGEITDPRAKAMFTRSIARTRNQAQSWGGDFERRHQEAALDVSWKASKDTLMQGAVNDPRPEVLSANLAELQDRNRRYAAHKGFDAEWLTATNNSELADIHSKVLDNLRDSDDAAGVTRHLEQYGDAIPEPLRAKNGRWVHERTFDETVRGSVLQMQESGLPFSEASRQIREMYAGEDEDRALSRLRETYADAQHERTARVGELMDGLHKQIYEQGGPSKVTDEQLDELAKYDAARAADLREQRRKHQESTANGGDFAQQTDYDTRDYLLKSIQAGDIKDPRILMSYKGGLDSGDYRAMESLIEAQQTVKSEDAEAAYRRAAGKTKLETKNDRLQAAAFHRWAADEIKRSGRAQDLPALAAKWQLSGEAESDRWWSPSPDKTFGEAVTDGDLSRWQADKPLERNAITQDYLDKQARNDEAMRWLSANPNDPRAAEIRKRMGL